MKIIGTTNLYNYSNQKQNVQPKYRYGVDTFTRATAVQNPSFKSNNVLKEILGNREFVYTVGLGAIVKELLNKDTDKNIDLEEDTSKDGISKFLQKLFNNKEEEKEEFVEKTVQTGELSSQEEIVFLKSQIDLKDKIIADLQAKIDAKKISSQTENQEPAKENNESESIVIFPKKRGRLTKPLEQLRKVTQNLDVPKATAIELKNICEELADKTPKIISGKEIDKNEIAANLAEELSKDYADYEKLAEYYSKKLGLTENPVSSNETEDFVALPTLQGTKIVGKIDLDSINNTKKPRNRIKIDTPVTGNDIETAKAEESAEKEEMRLIDKDTGTFWFKLPKGIHKKDIGVNLKKLLLQYEIQLSEEYENKKSENPHLKEPKWVHRPPMPVQIDDKEIMQEIYAYNRLKQTIDSVHTYENINKDNAYIVAEVINKNPLFNEIFTRHAALRLIDRYVDFDDEEHPVEEQAKNVVDKLVEIIQNALKKGVEVQTYEDKKYRGSYAPRIVIPTEYMDKETQEIFGTFPLKITFCENQPDKNFYNKHNKQALICTLFSKGI